MRTRYRVEMRRNETLVHDVFAASPEQAVTLAARLKRTPQGFAAERVYEADGKECFDVDGCCESCSAVHFDERDEGWDESWTEEDGRLLICPACLAGVGDETAEVNA